MTFCRKKVPRGGIEQQAESRWIIECLRWMRLVAKIWPVYSWDKSPPIFALLVTPQAALDELDLFGSPVTEGELERALRNCGIEASNASERLKAAIKAFYDPRKDRRIKKGYTRSGEAATGRDRPPLRDYIREDGLPGGRFPTPNGGA